MGRARPPRQLRRGELSVDADHHLQGRVDQHPARLRQGVGGEDTGGAPRPLRRIRCRGPGRNRRRSDARIRLAREQQRTAAHWRDRAAVPRPGCGGRALLSDGALLLSGRGIHALRGGVHDPGLGASSPDPAVTAHPDLQGVRRVGSALAALMEELGAARVRAPDAAHVGLELGMESRAPEHPGARLGARHRGDDFDGGGCAWVPDRVRCRRRNRRAARVSSGRDAAHGLLHGPSRGGC
mmetsp:Transcript_16776/g.37448  ORF Transcript_16776/g.37448 Transcript_16776/m.37448 type:complete len:239 (+) Transcript_16776:712-1428(+)